MRDYVERQASIEALGERPMSWTDSEYELGSVNQYDRDRLAIETVPAADVVNVVRCRDCDSAECSGVMIYCLLHGCYMRDNDFCNYGERKDGERNEAD